jgi:radical SAM superfamily enzyme YgiQ (UPF0313 family)
LLKDYENNIENSSRPILPKVVITTVPFIDENTPIAAPAVLKASLQANGIDCVGLDLNIEIYNKIQHYPNRNLFLNFFYKQIINEEIVDELTKILDFYAVELLSHKPDIIGLSLFSKDSQVFTAWLCAVLRQQAPGVKIVIGGSGLETLENSLFKFPDRLKKLGLIDDYITGDSETALVEYVRGNYLYPGINSTNWQPNKFFDQLPSPDFSDYRFFKYKYTLLPIVDSRGCVQACEFCDVIEFWTKFQYLTADNIFNQILQYITDYRVYRFQFASSICNGNLREFKKLVQLIADYNNSVTNSEQIHWVGSFIVRPATQHKEELFELIKRSNGFLLTGVESIVDRVRIALGKKFNNDDLDHHLQMLKKYGIKTNLLMIAAYPTETAEDYETVNQWFKDHKEYANVTIEHVQLTLPAILAGTGLERTIDLKQFNDTEFLRRQHGTNLIKILKECGYKVNTFF